MSERYSGPLSSYRKGGLKEIATAMDVELDPSALRFDLEDAIRDALRENESIRKDKRFHGLWEALVPEGEEVEPADPSTLLESAEEIATKAVSSLKSLSRTPRKSLSSLASNISTPTEHALASVEKQAKALVPSKDTPARLKRNATNTVTVYSKKSSSNLREAAQQARAGTTKVVAATQEIASSAWTIISLLIATEISYLAWSAVPWGAKAFGPHEWLTRSSTPAFAIRYPDISVLLHPTFTHAFLKWSFWTILLPLLASIILAFPQQTRTTHNRSTRRSNQTEVAAPNALSFALARTSIIILTGYIFAKPVSKVSWTFGAVEGYPALSLLASALSAVFAAYESK